MPIRISLERLLPLLLIIAILSLFWPILFDPDLILYPTFSPFSDTMVIHWPKAHLMAESWQAGHGLPHWMPLILSGMPLAANQLAMLSYPPEWLFLFLPLEPTFNFLFLFHLAVGGIGLYVLLRLGYELSPMAALLGGLTFALNGKLLAHAAGGHVSMVGAIAWMPWTLLGVVLLMKAEQPHLRMRLLAALIIALSLAMQIVTHTLPVIYSTYLVGAAAVWFFAEKLLRAHRRNIPGHFVVRSFAARFLFLGGACILGVLLGAGQLLPLLELVEFSNRSLTLTEAAAFSLSPAQLVVGLLLPSAQGGHELVIYLGVIPLVLAAFGLSRRQPWTWFYGGVLILAILFSLGPATPIHSLFYHIVPGFRWVRTPARIFFVGAIAVSVLAGFGFQRLSVMWPSLAEKWLAHAAFAVASAALLLGVGLAVGIGQADRAALVLAILVPLALVVIVLRVRGHISPKLSGLLLGLLLFLDLASFDSAMMRFIPPEEAIADGRAAAAYLSQQPGLFRSYSPSYSLPVQTAAAFGLQLAGGVEPVHLAVYDQYMARAGGYNDPSFSVTIPRFDDGPLATSLQTVEPDLKLLGMLNVLYLTSAFPTEWPGLSLETTIDGTYIYRNELALPRAWVAHQTVPAERDWLSQLEALPSLADVTVVENGPQLGQSGIAASVVEVTHYSADAISFETSIEQPGWLVLSEVWYPGWRATVNGLNQPVEKVNGLLRAVFLDKPGHYQVAFEFRPDSVMWGNRIAGAALVLVLVVGAWIGFTER